MTQSTMTIDREKKETIMSRIFDAPRELVFKTYTDPKLIPLWWGLSPTTIVDKMDVRPGGLWRYIQRDEAGNELAFNGVYREVAPPERLVHTFEFEMMPGHIMLETLTFEEYNGNQTKLTDRSTFENLEDLEGMLQSGAEQGANATWDRFEQLLATLPTQEK